MADLKITVTVDLDMLHQRVEALQQANRIDANNLQWLSNPENGTHDNLCREASERIATNTELINAYDIVIGDLVTTLEPITEKLKSVTVEVV